MTERDELGPPQRLPWSLVLAAALAIGVFVLLVFAVLLGRDGQAADDPGAESSAADYRGMVVVPVEED